MLARTAFLLTLALALSQPLSARAREYNRCAASAADRHLYVAGMHSAAAIQGAAVITPPSADDILAGKGPPANAHMLRQIAIYASIGNRDGVEILSQQLRLIGVSKDIIDEALTWAEVHAFGRLCSAVPSSITGVEATQ